MKAKHAQATLLIVFLLISFVIFIYPRTKNDNDAEEAATFYLEQAYFQGQLDAINGDIKIKLNSDSCYIWTDTPWKNGQKPIFNPTYLDSK